AVALAGVADVAPVADLVAKPFGIDCMRWQKHFLTRKHHRSNARRRGEGVVAKRQSNESWKEGGLTWPRLGTGSRPSYFAESLWQGEAMMPTGVRARPSMP